MKFFKINLSKYHLFSVYIGRWSFHFLNTPMDWLNLSWNERGYDGLWNEWVFGPFGEIIRYSDRALALEESE